MKPDEPTHLSTFALDLQYAGARDPDVERHLRACERCRRYLEQLVALEANPPEVVQVASTQRAEHRLPRMWAWTGAAAATMLATAIFFASWHRGVEEQEDGAYVGAKGAPSVQVLVRSQESHAVVWNGQEPIRPGDSLAFRVACEGFRQVAIAAPSKDGRSWVRLSAAACPTDASPLPFTLVADEQPGDERLAVVLSRRPLNDETLAEVVQRQVRAADVFAILITLPKSPVSP